MTNPNQETPPTPPRFSLGQTLRWKQTGEIIRITGLLNGKDQGWAYYTNEDNLPMPEWFLLDNFNIVGVQHD